MYTHVEVACAHRTVAKSGTHAYNDAYTPSLARIHTPMHTHTTTVSSVPCQGPTRKVHVAQIKQRLWISLHRGIAIVRHALRIVRCRLIVQGITHRSKGGRVLLQGRQPQVTVGYGLNNRAVSGPQRVSEYVLGEMRGCIHRR